MTEQGKALPQDGSALQWVRQGVFPEDWALIPVAGKDTYVKEWPSKKRSRVDAEALYQTDSRYRGFGVVTGELSGGLLAVDIDGPKADARFRAITGEAYEALGEESTMSWTSGRPGRRQILYRVPAYMVQQLAHVNTLICQEDSTWKLGKGDVDRSKAAAEGDAYEELVLRFNRCQSVLPQSIHPTTKKPYRFLNYNGGMPAEAPDWLLTVLRGFTKAQAWLSDAALGQLEEFAADSGTLLPPRQIRGWFFGDSVQALLMPRLEELVFKHQAFENGWKERSGDNPQRLNYCPWHGGQSGTSFQYSVKSGCWDCKACGVGGDVIDFIHKIESGDKSAGRPGGRDLETYVARLAQQLGLRYPEDANVQVTKEAPRLELDEVAFHEALCKIHDEESNPAIRLGKMAGLALATGRRLTGSQCLSAMDEYRYYEDARRKNRKLQWWQDVQRMTFTIPNVLKVPSQTVLHAQPGEGKTSACMGLAKSIGRGLPMKVRGIEVPVKQGNVLWIQNDQSPAKLLQDCEDNGIDPEKDDWFIVKRGFQLNHVKEMTEWIREYKPALVIVDSISSCSTKMQVSEIEKAFASPFYYISERNGDPGPEGFPATSIIWIHHDNAQGNVRGTKLLVAAMDEQWHLRKLKDDERDGVRERSLIPSSCRFIEIKKSRMGREGDRLIVHRDENFSYSVWDFTSTEKREDNGHGDPDPSTTCLKLVKQHVLGARECGGDDRITAQEVWEGVCGLVTGQGRRPPSSRTIKRWLERWVEAGLLVPGKRKRVEGVKQLVSTYTLPTTAAPRVGIKKLCPSFVVPPKPLQTLEITTDKSPTPEDDVRCSEAAAEEVAQPPEGAENDGHTLHLSENVHCSIPVVASDLGDQGAEDIETETTREAASPCLTPTDLVPLSDEPSVDDTKTSQQQASVPGERPMAGVLELERGGTCSDPAGSDGVLDGLGNGTAQHAVPHVEHTGEDWGDFDAAFGFSDG
jgi:hypothetical protein